jgi:hypothetical protein
MDLVKAAYLLLINVENTDIIFSEEYSNAVIALATLIEDGEQGNRRRLREDSKED